jgi:hypothetical protein
VFQNILLLLLNVREGEIKKEQSRETSNKTKKNKTKNTQNNMCWTPLYANNTKRLESQIILKKVFGNK